MSAAAFTTGHGHDVGLAPLISARLGSSARDDFVAAYADLHDRAYRVAFRLLGDSHEAEDIAQEALTRACVRWARLSEGGYAGPWVVHVSINLARDRWRRVRTARNYLSQATNAPTTSTGERVDLHRALDGLPERQREVVMLRYLADLSEIEVAKRLKLAPGTVKTHAARGLAALRSALEIGEDA